MDVDVPGTGTFNTQTTDGSITLDADGAANGDITLNAEDDITITAAGLLDINTTDDIDVDLGGTGVYHMQTTDGGITLDADGVTNGDITLNSQDRIVATVGGIMDLNVTSDFDLDVAGTGIIDLQTTDGNITLDADGATSGDINLNAQDNIAITATGLLDVNITEDIDIDLGGTGTFNTQTSNGEIVLDADGAASGDITLNAEDDITITAGGTITVNGDITNSASTFTTGGVVMGTTTEAGATMTDIDVSDIGVIFCTNAGAKTFNSLSNGVTGQMVHIMNTSANTLTLVHQSGNTQDFFLSGAVNLVLPQGASVTVVYNGTDWYAIGN